MNEKYYQPEKDTFMLEKKVLEFLENKLNNKNNFNDKKQENYKILEIGIGSGYILISILKRFPNINIIGIDINEFAIEETIKNIKKEENLKNKLNKTIKIFKSNLFENINDEFDLIYFNTPYLPLDFEDDLEKIPIEDKAIYGGKNGYETIISFLSNSYNHLKKDGRIIFLFSNLSKKDIIDNFLNNNEFNFKEIQKENVGMFETLYIYEVQFSSFLKKLKEINIKNVKLFSKGKHSKVFEGILDNNQVIIKFGLEQHIIKEKLFLEKLKEKSYVSKLYKYEIIEEKKKEELLNDKDKGKNKDKLEQKAFIVKEKINGTLIKEFLEIETNIENIIIVLKNIIEICFDLDKEKINKFEMTNPYKHIFIQKDLTVKMIDFERCIYTEHPKNTTQFLQYILRNKYLLEKKGLKISKEKILEISKNYKKNYKKFKFEKIISKN